MNQGINVLFFAESTSMLRPTKFYSAQYGPLLIKLTASKRTINILSAKLYTRLLTKLYKLQLIIHSSSQGETTHHHSHHYRCHNPWRERRTLRRDYARSARMEPCHPHDPRTPSVRCHLGGMRHAWPRVPRQEQPGYRSCMLCPQSRQQP